MSPPARARRTLAAAILLLAPLDAAAHGRSTSTSAWDVDPEARTARVTVRVAWPDLQRALPELGGVTPEQLAFRPDLAGRVDGYLLGHYLLLAGDEPCRPEGRIAALPSPDPTHVARRWSLRCGPGPLRVRADGFLEAVSSHLHLARLRVGDAPAVERALVLDHTEASLEAEAGVPAPSSVGAFVLLGVEHIATGFDHLVFLLALLLVGVSVAEVATIVTGFTLAHSVTLALGVLGWVEPSAAAVEALIGLSIAVVALENVSLEAGPGLRRGILASLAGLFTVSTVAAAAGAIRVPAAGLAGVGIFSVCYFGLLRLVARPHRLRWFIAFVFGLVHGFGFAGVLAEMELPRERIAHALFGFNLGVELGQLAIVLAAWPVLRFLLSDRWIPRTLVVRAGSAGVLAAGLFWFVSRAVG